MTIAGTLFFAFFVRLGLQEFGKIVGGEADERNHWKSTVGGNGSSRRSSWSLPMSISWGERCISSAMFVTKQLLNMQSA
jgi:hypothetical protein